MTTIDLQEPSLYINRELSWLQFNSRVLQEAEDSTQPLLERVKFLSIFFSNLDEFFMIRISGLREQVASGVVETSPDGLAPSDQLTSIRQELQDQLARASDCWQHELIPGLDAADIRLFSYHQITPPQRGALRRYFIREIFPALTPLAFDPTHPFPHISNLNLNLAVVANDPDRGECFARLKVPNIFPRLIRIPKGETAGDQPSEDLASIKDHHFVWLEDIIADNLDLLFQGLTIKAAYPFRITRDADLEIEEDEAADLLSRIEEQVDLRHFGSVIRLELDQKTPDGIREILIRNLNLAPYQVYTDNLPLGLSDIIELSNLEKPDLKYPPFLPAIPPRIAKKDSLISAVQQDDLLLHHPYDSFQPVVDFIREAAADPNVLAIKQTLYRVGSNSPIVEALMEARQNGKQVAVLLELKARFDEEK